MFSMAAAPLPPPDKSMLLMGPRSDAVRWLMKVVFREVATHTGIYFRERVYHITPKGLRISKLENVLAANALLAVAPLPHEVHAQAILDAAEHLQTKAYNRPLFWYMFFRGFCRNWNLPRSPELFRDPDKVMCADLLSWVVQRELASHELTPARVFERYAERTDALRPVPVITNEEVA